MADLNILFIFHPVKNTLLDFSEDFLKLFLDTKNVFHLDNTEIYNKYGFCGAHNYIEKFANNNNIDVIIYRNAPTDFDIDVYFFEKLRKNIFLVMMVGDTDHYYEVRDRYYAQAMDLVVVSDAVSIFRFRQIGINSISFYDSLDTNKFYKIENIQKNIDVSFVGNMRYKMGRFEYVNYLLRNNIFVETFGYGSLNGPATLEKKIEVYNRSKINLNFTGGADITRLTRKYQIHKRIKQLKGRIFEIATCGGFMLSEYVPGLEYVFEIGKEIDVFYNKEEMLEKVKYYLGNEDERENIAKRGCLRALKDYDIKLTLPKLLSTIEEFKKKKQYKPSEIYLDKEFIINYSTYRVLLIIKFIKSRKWKFALEELKIILKYRKLDWYQIRIFFIEEILGSFPRIKSVLKSIFKKSKK